MVGPVLIHIVTQKGKGYPPAEKNSELFHGTGPFDLKTGKQISDGKQTWSELMGSTLITLAQKDPKIIAITAAMTAGTGLTKFEETYPDRFFDVGIAEQHSVTLAAGMSTKGLKPFVAIYSTFLQRALDQIIHDVALPKLPVVFCIDRAGLVGEDGATHHGAFDLSYLNFVPNMIILTPSTAEELSAMLFWAANYQEGPVAIRYPRGTAIHSSVHKSFTNFNPFPAIIHSNKGKIALVACGDAFFTAEAVYNLLAKDKIPAQLIQLLSVKPLDKNTLLSLASTCNYIFTFENNAVIGGMGARIAQLLATEPVKVINFGYPDHFIAQGKNSELLDEIGFTPNKLHKQIVQTLNE
jgi:1-deoxy-D-xylulose-5-phosphate synthase